MSEFDFDAPRRQRQPSEFGNSVKRGAGIGAGVSAGVFGFWIVGAVLSMLFCCGLPLGLLGGCFAGLTGVSVVAVSVLPDTKTITKTIKPVPTKKVAKEDRW